MLKRWLALSSEPHARHPALRVRLPGARIGTLVEQWRVMTTNATKIPSAAVLAAQAAANARRLHSLGSVAASLCSFIPLPWFLCSL